MADPMRQSVAGLLRGIERYNPENLSTLERYVDLQARENAYDLEANLGVLKLYQFNPTFFQSSITAVILMKALTNLPHTDFVMCKALIDEVNQRDEQLSKVIELHELLEMCSFKVFWEMIEEDESIKQLISGINGFQDSIRKYVCHVLNITYQTVEKSLLSEFLGDVSEESLLQWVTKYGWTLHPDGYISIANHEEYIKTKNIIEKISFENVSPILLALNTVNQA